SLKKAGIPLYLDKEGNGDNMVNSLLWNMLMGAPLIAILAAAVQATRLLADDIGIDTFIHTVSPMDKYGYFNFGTGNDYSTRIAR
ncbi:hypothetical protein ONQ60_26995, partial [Salmonella enterica subsp. enterica serovar Virginia]|nr:hypothetical protein [Salmonella enterica subsp. enterica serovar Virginia]